MAGPGALEATVEATTAQAAPDGDLSGESNRHRQRLVDFGLFTIIVVYVAAASADSRGFIFDDPFIFFRYARNLATGHGWVFNIAQHGASAATSPLYVLVLALAYKAGYHNLVAFSRVIFVIGLSGCACLTYATLARLHHRWAGAAAAVLIASSPWIFMTRGMETALFLGLFALCLYLWVAGSNWALAVAMAGLVLVRPDGIVVVALILGAIWIRDRRVPSKTLVTIAAFGILWAIYTLVAGTSLLPETLRAKLAQGRSGFFNTFLNGFSVTPRFYGFEGLTLLLVVLALIGMVAVAAHSELRLILGIPLAALVLVAVAYTILGIPGAYPWYYAPLVFMATVFAGVALEEVGRQLVSRVDGLMATLPAILLVVIGVYGYRETPLGPPRPGYWAAAEWITEHTKSTATISSLEIGELGWYTNHPMVDYMGLLTTNVIPHLERHDDIWWVDGLRPDYWMVFRYFVWPPDQQVRRASWFHDVFRPVYSNAHVVVFKRIGLAPQH